MKRLSTNWLLAMLMIQFALAGNAAEKPAAAASTNSPKASAVTNNIGKEISEAIKSCKVNEEHDYTSGLVMIEDSVRPALVEYLNEMADGKNGNFRSEGGKRDEKFYSVVLVVIEPTNKIPCNREHWDFYIAGLCSLALGNEANVFIIDMTKFSSADKKLVRDTLSTKLGPKMKGQKDDKGKPIDLDQLLAECQVNTIGLVALDTSKPKVLTPIHSTDARYEEHVEGLMDKALATYNSWKKADKERNAKQKEKSE